MKKLLFKAILTSIFLTTTCIYASQEEEVGIYEYNEGSRRYGYCLNVDCGIFQFKEAKTNSPKAQLNEKLLETFLSFEENAKEKCIEYANKKPLNDNDEVAYKFFYRGDIRGRSYVYINKEKLFSARNQIYCESGYGAFVCEEGINYKVLANSNIEKIELEDLFETSENWLDPLLVEAINTIKENGDENKLWGSNAKDAIDKILNFEKEDSKMTKREYYISSFALKEETLVLIIQSLSIMPNAGGYPIVEIPFKRLKHLKNLDFIK